MKLRHLKSEVWLPAPLQEVFPFFSKAENLNELTPSWLNFRILTPVPIEMKTGTRIDYKIKIRFIPVRWRTNIKVWNPPHEFVDEQVSGPYRLWVHRHSFEPCDGGTVATDEVTYSTHLDCLLHDRWIRPDIEKIFAYRAEVLKKRFSEANENDNSGDDPAPGRSSRTVEN